MDRLPAQPGRGNGQDMVGQGSGGRDGEGIRMGRCRLVKHALVALE